MSRICGFGVRYAPLYILTFRILSVAKRYAETLSVNLQCRRYEDMQTIPDRLRFCRQRLGLLQKEVAEKVGLTRCVYSSLETDDVCAYDPVIMGRLAVLFGIPEDDLLNDYSRFLQSGQGQAILRLRESLNMTRPQFAQYLHTDVDNITIWETEKKRISKEMWEKRFKCLMKNSID